MEGIGVDLGASLGASGASMTAPRDVANSTLLREQQNEREKLLMDNFNQALRINYLEERLLRLKQGTDFAGEDLESEIAQLRIALEEREHDIKQRNMAMIRATEAIDVLTTQLNAAKSENDRLVAELKTRAVSRMDPDTLDKWRRELERTADQEHAATLRVRELEGELSRHEDTIASMTAKLHELEESRARDRLELDNEMQIERQKSAQQAELAHAKVSADADQWREIARQREDHVTSLKQQLEAMMKEKEALDARYQSKMKRMEEEVQAQMNQLQQESEKYRAEHTRLLTDREKSHFDRDRIAMEAESIKQERSRLQAEIERLSSEMQRFAGEAERLRLQNVKLTALCDDQTKSLDGFRADREAAMDTIHQLESEGHEWRKKADERELTIKSLEMRLEHAEAEAKSFEGQRDSAVARGQQTSNERLAALEKDRLAIEEDNHRLRVELTNFQHELETLEQNFQACEQRLADESSKAQDYRTRALDCEDELARKAADVQDLERRVADLQAANSMTENARLQQQNDAIARFAAEKNELLISLQQERRRADDDERTVRELETKNATLVRDLDDVEKELRILLSTDMRGLNRNGFTLASVVRDVVTSIQKEFKNEMARLQSQHQQQLSSMNTSLDRLAAQLHASQLKLETLQTSAFRSRDEKQNVDQSWATRYEKLRVEAEAERRALEGEVRRLEDHIRASDSALDRAKTELESSARERDSSRDEWERNYYELKETNRLLYDEVQERRRSAEHARKQYMHAVRENKELLAAIEVYKKAIADRNNDIEYYKGVLMKYTQQLQRRVSMGEVKQTLLDQLEQTQYMINATYKRWSESDIGPESQMDAADDAQNAAVAIQLDEYLGRVELATERWAEFVVQTKQLSHQYGDAWRTGVGQLNSRSSAATVDRPRWVDDVERKCTRLLNESVRVSETMRDIVENIALVIQRERDERKRKEKERALHVDKLGSMSSPRKPRGVDWNPATMNGFGAETPSFTSPRSPDNQSSVPASPVKNRNGSTPMQARRSSTKSAISRLAGSPAGVYNSSLVSLGRIGVELETIERKIRNEHS